MATLATHFKTALSNIEPSEDAKNAQSAHAEVTAALEADDLLANLGVDPLLIGSYGRHVSIRRVKDVDVFARLSKAGKDLRPGKILDHVEAVLEAAFPGRATQTATDSSPAWWTLTATTPGESRTPPVRLPPTPATYL